MATTETTKQGLSSAGLEVKINSVAINNVQEIGDVGGATSELDATCLKDRVKKHIPGVQDMKAWEITYLYDNTSASSDFRRLKALQTAGNVVPVEVDFPDGSKFTSTGYISTYITGTKVDELIVAKAMVHLQADWTVTNPSAT